MWICHNKAFVSIVQPDPRDVTGDKLLVRSRRPGDIKKLFPTATVKKTPGRDYLFRAFIDRAEVANVIAQALLAIGYGNFKASVADDDLHRAYNQVWSVMSRLQPIPPYSTGKGRQGRLL